MSSFVAVQLGCSKSSYKNHYRQFRAFIPGYIPIRRLKLNLKNRGFLNYFLVLDCFIDHAVVTVIRTMDLIIPD
jgi:hypothetical protein